MPELAGFDAAMQRFMADRHIPAGTLAVAKDGQLLLARGYGHRDKGRTQPLPPDAPLRLASVTKPMTAAVVRRLIRDGKLSADQPVFAYIRVPLPDGADERLAKVTVGHLLAHRGGWDRGAAFDPMFRPVKIAEAEGVPAPAGPAAVIRYMTRQPLQFDPGAKSAYSNFGYCLLGRVIETATGQPYPEALRAGLFEPLGMTTAALGRTRPADRDRREPWYSDPGRGRSVFPADAGATVPAPDGTFHLEAMDAHGGLIASAPDVARFLAAYHMDGRPRPKGASEGHSFFGSLPGTWSLALQRADGVDVVALFNQREDSSGKDYAAVRELLNAAADRVTTWPGGK